MIHEFSYQFKDLEISNNDIALLMGFNTDNFPDPFPELIEKAMNEVPEIVEIKAGYNYFRDFDVDETNATLTINGNTFQPGKIIFSQLKKATSIAVFVCTAGKEISNQSAKLTANGNNIAAYVYDIFGSVVTEKARKTIENDLKKESRKTNLNISDSFSPGLCDWNISDQKKLFALLPERFCGITLSDSLLMNPIKSVSGIIGIGKSLKQKGYQCSSCIDFNCLYGKIKRLNKK
jgi:hypothetical protein